jgi:multiple sugar transport system substrate-binding protein
MMKNVLLVTVVIAVIMFGLLPAAAQEDGEFRPTFELEGPSPEGELAGVDPTGVEFDWWHQYSGSREQRLMELVGDFNQTNPWNITVNASAQGGYRDISQKVMTGLTTGDLPVLVVAYQIQALEYSQAGAVFNIQTLVDDGIWGLNDVERTDYLMGLLDQDIDPGSGARLGFPLSRSFEVLYYNVAALEQLGYAAPPTTWDEFGEMACAYAANGSPGYVFSPSVTTVFALNLTQGASWTDPDSGTIRLDNPTMIDTLTSLQTWVQDSCAQVTSQQQPYSDRNVFAAGQSLFWIGSSASMPYLVDGPAFGVAYLPYNDTPGVEAYGASQTILQGGSITPEQQVAAWLFLRWLSEPAQQAKWTELTGGYPVRKTLDPQLAARFEATPQMLAAWELLQSGVILTEPTPLLDQQLRQEASEAFNNILALGADVKATLESLDISAS